MKNFTYRCIIIALLLFANHTGFSQLNLNWLTSFSPVWADGNTSGNANNVSGYSVNCATMVSISGGSFTWALGGSGAQTPTVSGATFTVPGSTNRMQLTPNFANNTNYVNVVFTFSALVTNVAFKIVDIDKTDANSNAYFDRVTVTGSDGVSNYNASITKYDAITNPNFLIISGNTAYVNTTNGQAGNSASSAADQLGTINVSFGSTSLRTVTVRYDNAPGSQANPAAQAIGIGTISFQMSTLPVTLTKFTAALQNDKAILNWKTETEINSDRFEIEKSSDGTNWTKLGTVKAAGNSNLPRNYKTEDAQLHPGINYYRLKQIDIDQRYQYSTIVSVIYEPGKLLVKIYPNPIVTNIFADIYSDKNQTVTVRLQNVSGQLIKTATWTLEHGSNKKEIPASQLPPGVYILDIIDISRQYVSTSKLLKN